MSNKASMHKNQRCEAILSVLGAREGLSGCFDSARPWHRPSSQGLNVFACRSLDFTAVIFVTRGGRCGIGPPRLSSYQWQTTTSPDWMMLKRSAAEPTGRFTQPWLPRPCWYSVPPNAACQSASCRPMTLPTKGIQ